MAGQLVTQPLGAIGSAGMNTQASPIDLPPEFATLAINCYADEAGRPTARKSAQKKTTDNVDLGSGAIKRAYRHNKADGTSQMFLAGGGLFYRTQGTTQTTLTAGPYGDDFWQFASLNGKCFAAKSGTTPVQINETTYAVSNVTVPANPLAIHSAYGRLWALSSSVLYWSDLLDGTNFSTGASGSLDLQKIHTQFRDTAVAVTSFNGQIVVLCRNSVYVLGLASDKNPNSTVAPIYLRDFIPNIGCVARDTVVSTGDDVLFVSDDGVRSLSRSMSVTQGPAPLTDVSAPNKDYTVKNLVKGNAATSMTALWNPVRAWYMVFAADTKEVWVFDFGRRSAESMMPRMFIWRMGTLPLYCGLWWTDEVVWYGASYGMYTMETYNIADAYTMSITTGWLSLGGPERLDSFKRVMVNLSGGSGQTASLKWGVDFNWQTRTAQFALDASSTVYEFNIAEYEAAEFGNGAQTAEIYINIGAAGKVIQFTLEFPIDGFAVTLNNMLVFFKQGRVR